MPAAANADGSPAWTIQDPVRNSFYRIGWLEFEMLSYWHLGSARAVLEALQRETLLAPTADELLHFRQFLQQNHLLEIHAPQHTRLLLAEFRASTLSRAQWLLHNYLFIRIPLCHPDRVLAKLYPLLAWIYTRATAVSVVLLSLSGLVLAFRQWDMVKASFLESLSPTGLLSYLLALAVAKSLHEFGHALTATRYGVRVAHMGVAFLVLWPVLYTDTRESWRLRDRRQRLAISSAGILTELSLAGIATLAWCLAPIGDARQALFFLATTSWLFSLALNASPFMRFDGYFILSDLLDFPNLHERSFALARTALRNRCLGWNDPWPEEFPAARRNGLIAFAVGVWLYRLVTFTGIAIAVYFMFFKLLGIILFTVEIGWFVLRPIWNEIRVWRTRHDEIPLSRKHCFVMAGGALLLVGLIPWNAQIHAEAWAHAGVSQVFYSPIAARIETVPLAPAAVPGDAVVFTLVQPELDYRERVAQLGARTIENQLSSLVASPDRKDQQATLLQERAMRRAQSHAESAEQERLTLRASFPGVLTDIDPQLKPGVWVNPNQPLATLIDPVKWQVEAFVSQDDVERLAIGAPVRFYPDDNPLSPLYGHVTAIDSARTSLLPSPLLSSRHGGKIAVLPEENELAPRQALFRVLIQLQQAPSEPRVVSGIAILKGQRRSWFGTLFRSVVVVLIREASF